MPLRSVWPESEVDDGGDTGGDGLWVDLPMNFSPGKNFCLKNLTFSSAC